MLGTGGELAEHLIDKLGLEGVGAESSTFAITTT